jgi:hypothetical protein
VTAPRRTPGGKVNLQPGTFYLRSSDQLAFRCEAVNHAHALLHLADAEGVSSEGTRVTVDLSADGWIAIPAADVGPHLATYERVLAELGPGLDAQGAVFRRQYHLDPYLSGIGEGQIQDRLSAIGDNLVRYDHRGAPRLLREDEGLLYWRKKAEEIVEELRGRGSELFEDSRNLPDGKVLRISHDIRRKRDYERYAPWDRVPWPSKGPRQCLFKFGERTHLRDALETGRLRISPAGKYADPSLSAARHDDAELKLVLRPSKTGFPILVRSTPSDKVLFDTSDRSRGPLAIELGGDRDYYVWCCTKTYEPRLYVDFSADACLVIHDHREFRKRLGAAVAGKAPHLSHMIAGDVEYYDPLQPNDRLKQFCESAISIFLYKQFSFAYQAEYRFVWPLMGTERILPLYVELGGLKDICELLVIDPPAGHLSAPSNLML